MYAHLQEMIMRVIAMTPEQVNQLPPQDRAITVQLVSPVFKSLGLLILFYYSLFADAFEI